MLTGWVEDRALEEMKKTLTRSGLQRITSSAGKYAGAWLTAIPSVYALQLKDKAMAIASRFRLGLVLQDGLPVPLQLRYKTC